MAKYQAYAEYKDSGVEWLGEIPSHWNLYSLKRSVDKCTNGFWGNEPDGRNDLCVLRVADFNRDNFTINEDKLTLRSVLPKEAESRLLKKGDLLIEKSGGGEKTLVGCVVQFDKDFPAITSNFVAKMTPNVITDSKYLTYAFAHLYSGRVNFPSIKQTTGIQNLDSEAYLMEKFGFPSKNEQIQIANFLDHETRKIDHLIEKQQQLIELLKEKRQAVISHAVTKGLDPNVPMKDSGVEWLGEVPEHWTVMKFNRCVQIRNGLVDPRDNNYKNFILYAPNHIEKATGKILYKETAEEQGADSNKYLCFKGEVVYSKIRPALAKVAICEEDMALCSADMYPMNACNGLTNDFLYHFILSDSFTKAVILDSDRVAMPKINRESLNEYRLPIPPVDEQVKILKYIEISSRKLDELEQKALQAIQLMQERRTALISAAVTGKIDVRNWQAPTLAEAKTELSA
ncbi:MULTISPECIES: restriction endonuclease subunit S [Acinetobacter calcoaceticus/baumannii complex]|uniref:restriction endonuclease subunit S n=1 Tax=Acinetobacter calcoaceticus/baumannii complex TaxID=909768 RepID=UPI001EEA42F7|nr:MULTISPECIES: restriction endonuclease subunit S [Acinetobacter calcoaceticus/baumannii complex]MCU4620381.1 restriction endonuclease subunit S [Acinetobacter pittii]MCZ3308787.1 restriction endonuclease subunit S [Acinetobacter baumannii]HCR0029542.1 restriction endonuclease subunit S [Acinetobacter baumannii]HCW5733513.1 restriction endonuclease subunit S [Acinetobacter baumannii]